MITATSSINVFSAWSRGSGDITQRGQINRKPQTTALGGNRVSTNSIAISTPPPHAPLARGGVRVDGVAVTQPPPHAPLARRGI